MAQRKDFQISVPRLRSPMNPGSLWRVIGMAATFQAPVQPRRLNPLSDLKPRPPLAGAFLPSCRGYSATAGDAGCWVGKRRVVRVRPSCPAARTRRRLAKSMLSELASWAGD
jgi:hypothetical protein